MFIRVRQLNLWYHPHRYHGLNGRTLTVRVRPFGQWYLTLHVSRFILLLHNQNPTNLIGFMRSVIGLESEYVDSAGDSVAVVVLTFPNYNLVIPTASGKIGEFLLIY